MLERDMHVVKQSLQLACLDKIQDTSSSLFIMTLFVFVHQPAVVGDGGAFYLLATIGTPF